jgi:TatD DNase family protein
MNAEFSAVCTYLRYVITEAEAEDSTPLNKLLDFDANLFHKDVDFLSATQRAQENGVAHFVVPGSTLMDSLQAIEAAEKESCIVAATAGVHPYNTESTPLNEENLQLLRTLISSPHCGAVGECGLDFSDGFPSSSFQVDWFR